MGLMIRELTRVADVPLETWNALVGRRYPFLRHEFLDALESTGCVDAESGWVPRHLSLWQGERLVGVLPHYLKMHSFGEYVFDWSWADAWERAGGRYYPKRLSAIPFTPAIGPRLAVASDISLTQAIQAVAAFFEERGDDVSSWHLLFADEREVTQWQVQWPSLLRREAVRFEWRDAGYGDFEGFLASMVGKRRKEIRRERRKVAEQGLSLHRLSGGDIDAAALAHFYRCYRITYLERGQMPYLSEAFFTRLRATMGEALMLVQVRQGDTPVAAALYLQGGDTLYGRYWGSEVVADCLHFEACYYQGIEYCLEQGLKCFDPGTQGEHKLLRGFSPELSTSLHYLPHSGFREAVARFCVEERQAMGHYRLACRERLPFRPVQ
ncbi:GNAT family N-acetyltransferase [Chromohalobacter canadensis]|uniref:GNAT family N-acetyltransferase n=2 Tax=Chromohalobacter canadensis TaxID=141389 RepID=A0ABZ0YFB9_9GAMM|nr:GNAT family N-acetyltransferase [Chromohalobacter canadensis]MCK0768451.1 GNAT family N-acetyltransferase [Chromohalobacter canadensis]WQH10770.1 GNAT family N-acetyltransferase [Chromohalobacter canadensis]